MTHHHYHTWLLLAPLLGACGLRHIDEILAKYDTFGETGTTLATDTSTGETGDTSTGDTSTAPEPDTTSSTSSGGEAGLDASGTTGATTDADPASTGSSSTGPAPPFCGDGHVDPGETCDDMNDDPDDGCKLCTKDLIVFVTSEVFQGGKIGGLFIADQRCRMHAALAKLPNFADYRAWLSDSHESAAERIFHSPGRYILVNGLVVADDWAQLTSGELQNPINVTAMSQTYEDNYVWTGTLVSGEPALGGDFCADWLDQSKAKLGGAGIAPQTDALWSFLEQNDCGSESALYCFEQPPD